MYFFNLLVSFFRCLTLICSNQRGSFEVTTAMVDMFSSNVMHLSQQKGSRLEQFTRRESQDSESKFWDRIGKRKARRKEGRHSDVVYTDTPHSRRMVTLEDWYDADLVDEEDKLRVIMNPESEYLQAIAFSLGRQKDETIIDFALGNAYGGKKGNQAVPLPNSQKVAAHDGSSTTGNGMNVRTLRAIRKKFKQSESIEKGEQVVLAHAAQQLDDLLGDTQATSSDFASVKALVDGEMTNFMGFEFVETELLPFNEANVTYNISTGKVGSGSGTYTATEARRSIAFTKNRGLLFAQGLMVEGSIDRIPGKHNSHQVYGKLSIGGSRMEEEQVIEVFSKEV
mgnify:CR=1 FL=1